MVRDDLAERHGLPAERLVVIPNGVDLELFRPPADGERDGVFSTRIDARAQSPEGKESVRA